MDLLVAALFRNARPPVTVWFGGIDISLFSSSSSLLVVTGLLGLVAMLMTALLGPLEMQVEQIAAIRTYVIQTWQQFNLTTKIRGMVVGCIVLSTNLHFTVLGSN